jgi:hypothetical protein
MTFTILSGRWVGNTGCPTKSSTKGGHPTKPVRQHEDITVLWNQGVQTDREVLTNRPVIIIKNKKDKICLLIDVAIPSDRNVIQEESEKELKYKNLSIEIQRMWNSKCFVIPVITGATGIVTRGLKKYLEIIPGKQSIDSLQRNICTRNITHYKESATIRNLKLEWWGSPLVQEEECQEEPVKREEEGIIIIIIIIIINGR